eukprot:gb/GEZN01001330.1/.p1 GENE.gb/GEZN01001330.1/~~gb/GEZN01001330.1/.p1  ORF type:complete len:829 (+),score=178.97 gb/GEZN01001330.1/:185-2671(+)
MDHGSTKVWVSDMVEEVEMNRDDLDQATYDELATESEEQMPDSAPVLQTTAPIAGGGGGGGGGGILSFLGGLVAAEPQPQAQAPRMTAPQQNSRQQSNKMRFRSEPVQRAAAAGARGAKLYRQAVDTSVIAIKLGTLAEKATVLMTGDPLFCSNVRCRAVFSSLSQLLDQKQAPATPECQALNLQPEQQVWVCEFCSTANAVDLAPEERPSADSVDYILEPPEQKGASSQDESKVIFVIDTSGSMCVTQEVEGSIKLKGVEQRRHEFEELLEDGDDRQGIQQQQQQAAFQRRAGRPAGSKQKTYVSRLQCVQAAVDAQLDSLKTSHPLRKVCLVSFSSECTVHGDCTEDPLHCAGDKLARLEELAQIGSTYDIKQPIGNSADTLKKKLFSLEEKGQTCLGPALLLGISVAAQTRGSQVILCTDGLANVGLGNLEGGAQDARQFYEQLAAGAARDGVTVSVVSITDQEASLENLGLVADATGGRVDRIDPLKLTDNFTGILENKVVAVRAEAAMLLHDALQFRGDISEEGKLNKDAAQADTVHRLTKAVGNVFAETELFFEYSVRPDAIKKAKGLKTIPFQVQIRYTRLDGSKCIRVLSQTREVTSSKDEVMKNMDHAVMAANAMQRSAALAQQGDYEASRFNNVAWGHYMRAAPSTDSNRQRSVLTAWNQQAAELDGMMHQLQQTEISRGHDVRSMTSDAKRTYRSSGRSDAISSAVYKSKQARSSEYVAKSTFRSFSSPPVVSSAARAPAPVVPVAVAPTVSGSPAATAPAVPPTPAQVRTQSWMEYFFGGESYDKSDKDEGLGRGGGDADGESEGPELADGKGKGR